MNMSCIYENRHQLPDDVVSRFTENRKRCLNTIEHIGLETILCLFVEQYEEIAFGQTVTKICDYTRWNENGVDILDGYYDTYVFDNYAISEIWMTDNGCILLDCYKLEHPDYDSPTEILRCVDWQSECKAVTFRVD